MTMISFISFSITSAIVLAAYLQTASDSIAGGDAGELVAEGCKLGTAHPPGYPLYTIIVFFVTSIGKNFLSNAFTPVYLVNVTSCVFGSLASGLVSATVYELTNDDDEEEKQQRSLVRLSASVSAGIMMAFSPLMWQYNTSAEVFALHNLFVAVIVYVLTKFNQEQSWGIVATGAFFCGLSLTNQHTSILLIVPVAAWVLFHCKQYFRISVVTFLLGMSCYVLLPIFANLYPHAGSWGDVTTIRGFMHHFLRRDYGTLQLWSGGGSNATETMIERTLHWVTDLSLYQFCNPALLLILGLGAIGASLPRERYHRRSIQSHKHKRKKQRTSSRIATGRVIVAALLFYLTSFHSLSNLPLSNPLLFGIHQRFWMHPNLLCFVFVGIGFDTAARPFSSKTTSGLMSMMMLALPWVTFKQNFEMSDQSQNKIFHGYATSILETLPPRSLLLVNYDQSWTSIRYIQECEGLRDDVLSINLSMMTYPWFEKKQQLYDELKFPGSHYTRGNNGGFTISQFIEVNLDNSDIFIVGRLSYEDPTYIQNYEEVPLGFARQIKRRSVPKDPAEVYRNTTLHVWRKVTTNLLPLPSEIKYPESTWEWTVRREFVDHLVSRSIYLLELSLSSGQQPQTLHSLVEAVLWQEVAISLDEKLAKSPLQKNLGLACMNIVRSKEANFPIVDDIFFNETKKKERWAPGPNEDWKAWATNKWQLSWGEFLQMDSARQDTDFHTIRRIYETVMKSAETKR